MNVNETYLNFKKIALGCNVRGANTGECCWIYAFLGAHHRYCVLRLSHHFYR